MKEHYLRSDIPCGSKLCNDCKPLYAILGEGALALPETDGDEGRSRRNVRLAPILSAKGRQWEGSQDKGHYLIIDTNVALHQVGRGIEADIRQADQPQHSKMDLLEHSLFGADIIILQTVLEEVKHRSLPLFNRLQALLQEEDRRVWLFHNDARWCAPSRKPQKL